MYHLPGSTMLQYGNHRLSTITNARCHNPITGTIPASSVHYCFIHSPTHSWASHDHQNVPNWPRKKRRLNENGWMNFCAVWDWKEQVWVFTAKYTATTAYSLWSKLLQWTDVWIQNTFTSTNKNAHNQEGLRAVAAQYHQSQWDECK